MLVIENQNAIEKRNCCKCEKEYEINISSEWWEYRTYCSEECKNKLHECQCKKCDRKFYQKSKSFSYCSDKCRIESCLNCNKSYIKKNNMKFCSQECREFYYTKTCPICEEKFFSTSESKKICSRECKNTIKEGNSIYKFCEYCKAIIKVFNRRYYLL